MVIILKKTNPIPSHPINTVIDNKLEPKSFWSKSDILQLILLFETIHNNIFQLNFLVKLKLSVATSFKPYPIWIFSNFIFIN